MIYRPKRSVHCRACDVCVESFDHHCPYISNCVGRRNYRYFFGFINILLLDTIYVFAVSIHDIRRRSLAFQFDADGQFLMERGDALKETMKQIPLVPMVIFLSGLTLLPLTVLVVYHYKLSMFNQTTYEQRKDTFTFNNRPPFESSSLLKNMWVHIFAPRP